MSRRRVVILFLTILAVAVLIRAVWLSHLAGSDIASELSIDSRFYRGLAEGILRGDPLPAGALSFNPLYPFFLVAVFKTLGDTLMATRVLQVIIGLATIALVYAAGGMLAPRERKGRFSGATVALVAMGMMVWYTQLALYEGMLLATSLEVFLLVASLVLCLALDEALHGERTLRLLRWNVPAWLAALLIGAACGAGALGRPNLFLLLVVGIPVWLVARNTSGRRWLMPLVGFGIGAALFLLPPTLYNAKHAGQFVPVTTHGGINFYIGNRPGTEGVYSPPPGMRGEQRGLLEDAHAAAEKAAGRTLTDAEASDYYMQKALDGIRSDPGGWLILLGRKLLLFWNKVEVHDLPEVVYFQDSMRLFRFPFLGFGLIAPLALAGLVVFLRGGRNRTLVCLYLVMAHVSVLLFYVNARYRLPVVPVMILLAAYFVAWFAEAVRGRERRRALATMGLAVVVFFLVSNRTFVQANQGSVYTYLGTYYMNAGQKEKAEEMFAKAYQMDPNRDTSLINYGRTLLLQDKPAEAARVLSQAYAQNPRYPHLAAYLAMALQRAGRNDDAATLAQRLLTEGDNEDRVTAYKVLATGAFFQKDLGKARRLVEQGLAIAPDDPELAQMRDTLAGMQTEQE